MSAPIPTQLKLINGNPGKRAVNNQEPDPPYLADFNPPWYMKSEVGKQFFRELAPIYARNRVLCETDVPMFVQYCEALAELSFAEEKVSAHYALGRSPRLGDERPYWYPWIKVRDAAAERVAKLAGSFGGTPADRTKIRTNPQGDLFGADFESYLRLVT